MLSLPTDAQMISPGNEKISLMDSRREVINLVGEVQYSSNKVLGMRQTTVDGTSIHLRRSRATRRLMKHNLETVHGVVNIIGWGILVPSGVISARYFKTLTILIKNSQEEKRYSIHVVSQVSGFILGTIGWGLGLYIRSASSSSTMSLHGILGTIIFCLSVIQVRPACCACDSLYLFLFLFLFRCACKVLQITLGLRLMAIDIRVTEISKKLWRICHAVMGYILIVLITVNIFEGIENQRAANRWNWSYGVILVAFSFVALCLEVLRWRFNEIDLSN